LRQRSCENREGEKRTVMEMEFDEVGPSLRYATAKVNKASRQGGASGSGGYGPSGGAADDPWSAAPQAGAPAGSGNGAGGFDDEPPF